MINIISHFKNIRLLITKAILNAGLGCPIKFWKDTIQWASQGLITDGRRIEDER
jgi:hypothetical protein